MEEGYALHFTRSGLVFDFDKPGTEPPEREVGVEFHRIGSDLIRTLVAQAAPHTTSVVSTDGDSSEDSSGSIPPGGAPPSVSPVPRLNNAAFLVGDREHVIVSEIERPKELTAPASAAELIPMPINAKSEMSPSVAREQRRASEPEHLQSNRYEEVLPEVVSDVFLGTSKPSKQFGLIGEAAGRKIALDLNETHTISLFGVQGGGKSYTLGSIIEMSCVPIAGVNELPQPLATVIFHYSPTLDYRPEFTSMVGPNTSALEVKALRERYGAEPRGMEDVVILTPAAKVDERKREYPGIPVFPIAFSASELKASHWKFLMGAVGSQSMYIRQIGLVLKKLRGELTLDALRDGIEHSGLSDQLKDLAKLRLRFAEEYIDDTRRLTDVLRPARLVIVDLRDELVEKDEALGLFVVLLQMFAETTNNGRSFNKLVVFDEAHKYVDSPDLIGGLVEVVREMRHKGTSILVASQDPPSVPTSLIELSSQIILHKFNSPSWLKHIQKANSALEGLSAPKLAALGPGEAYVWSSKATDDAFTKGAVKIRCRPRVTQHGGGTKTALG